MGVVLNSKRGMMKNAESKVCHLHQISITKFIVFLKN